MSVESSIGTWRLWAFFAMYVMVKGRLGVDWQDRQVCMAYIDHTQSNKFSKLSCLAKLHIQILN